MKRWCLLAASLLLACKSDKPPHTSPTPSDEPPASASSQPSAEAQPTSAPAESGGAATAEDRRVVVQLVIDDPELDPYLKLGQPGRFPLQISGEDLPAGLTKSAQPVKIVDAPAADAPVIVFTRVEVGAKEATVRYVFGAEGIKGNASLEKTSLGWQLVRSRIIER